MINYELKAEVIKNGLTKKVNYSDRQHFLNSLEGVVYDYKLEDYITSLIFEYGYDQYKEAKKVNNASYKRIKRLSDRIRSYLLLGKCIFATFTFTDEVLKKTDIKTRRKYISRFCKSVCECYVANVDYGSNTEREHYHALLLVDYIEDKWKYGFTWFEKVTSCNNSEKLLAKYISKLTNHAIKETTKRNIYIYSRSIYK